MARKIHTVKDENLGTLQLRQAADPQADAPTLHRFDETLGDGCGGWTDIGDDHEDYDASMNAFLNSFLAEEGRGELSEQEEDALIG